MLFCYCGSHPLSPFSLTALHILSLSEGEKKRVPWEKELEKQGQERKKGRPWTASSKACVHEEVLVVKGDHQDIVGLLHLLSEKKFYWIKLWSLVRVLGNFWGEQTLIFFRWEPRRRLWQQSQGGYWVNNMDSISSTIGRCSWICGR